MTFPQAMSFLEKNKTKKGNFKKQAVIALVSVLASTSPCVSVKPKDQSNGKAS